MHLASRFTTLNKYSYVDAGYLACDAFGSLDSISRRRSAVRAFAGFNKLRSAATGARTRAPLYNVLACNNDDRSRGTAEAGTHVYWYGYAVWSRKRGVGCGDNFVFLFMGVWLIVGEINSNRVAN